MHWVLQTNVFNEWGMKRLLEVLMKERITFSVHKVTPFTGEICPDISPEGPVMCLGAHSFRHLAKRKKWTPGVFDLSDFTYEDMISHWGRTMLNHDAKTYRFDSIEFPADNFFIKPDTDQKLFAGYVTSKEDFQKWQAQVLYGNDLSGGVEPYDIKPYTPVVVSTIKDIEQEMRFWVVDGKVVTYSQYKLGNKVIYSEEIAPGAEEFVYNRISQWQPHRAFVIDVAKVGEEDFRVIEINTLNSSGLYDCDVECLVYAIETMKI